MIKSTNKLILSAVVAGFLVSCGSSSNTTTPESNTTAPESNTTITMRTNNSQGKGDMSGTGTLMAYDGIYEPILGEDKKLFAFYMIGSDLERKFSSGTTDFTEMIEGYKSLTQEQKDKIDIIIAFGGTNKDGWRGMKIATIDQLINDASDDNVFGDSDDYQYVAPEANMGYKDSFKLFLKYVKNNYNNHSVKFLDMWDHGAGSVFIVGKDDNFGGNNEEDNTYSVITNNDIEGVFKDINISFDIIGFDTCLNASMEVAKSIQPYASYMLASEETEPGHGWNYKDVVMKYTTITDLKVLGTALVDSFIDSEEHQSTTGKTLSFVDLSKYQALLNNINKMGDIFKTIDTDSDLKDAFIPAIRDARGYNISDNDQSKKASVDVQHFMALLKINLFNADKKEHNAYILASDIINNVNDYVVYNKHDEQLNNSTGVAIFSPNDDGNQLSWLQAIDGSKVSIAWFNGVKSYQDLGKSDTTKPVIKRQRFSTTIATNDLEASYRDECSLAWRPDGSYEEDCLAYHGLKPIINSKYRSNGTTIFAGEGSAFINKNSKSKLRSTNPIMNVTTATFSDDNLNQVKTVYGNIVDGEFLTTAILQAKPTADNNGTYFTPIWNQKWYTFTYEDNKQSAWIPLVFKQRLSNGNVIYVTEIDYVNSKGDYSDYIEGNKFDYARLEIVIDENNNLVSNTIQPYTIEVDTNGKETILLSKTAGSLKIGDKVQFYSQNFDINTDEIFFNQESGLITLKKEFSLDVEELEFEDENGTLLEYYYMMVADDINSNRAYTTLQKAQKDN
ncbi:MAG: clostripain-related cysteine peptidase [Sulfurovum sp.]|nr:clostripain-related cysteine peptidase [Sulfurovum sp.]